MTFPTDKLYKLMTACTDSVMRQKPSYKRETWVVKSIVLGIRFLNCPRNHFGWPFWLVSGCSPPPPKKKKIKKRRNAPSPVLLSHSCVLTLKVLASYEKITWFYTLIWPVKDIIFYHQTNCSVIITVHFSIVIDLILRFWRQKASGQSVMFSVRLKQKLH